VKGGGSGGDHGRAAGDDGEAGGSGAGEHVASHLPIKLPCRRDRHIYSGLVALEHMEDQP